MVRRLTSWILGTVLVAGAQGAVLIWDHDNGATLDEPGGGGKVGTEYGVTRALTLNGVAWVRTNYLPLDLSRYDAVFVLLGFWPHDGSLTYAEQQRLRGYLAGGGNLYMEGTDAARRYSATPLFCEMGVGFADDGRDPKEGNVNVLEGIGPWAGFAIDYYAYLRGMPDAYVDELTPVGEGTEVVGRSRRAGFQSNARLIRREVVGPPSFRVVYSSFIFSSLLDGSFKKRDLMAIYVQFLGLNADNGGAVTSSGVYPASLGRIRARCR